MAKGPRKPMPPRWTASVTVSPPRDGTLMKTGLQQWLNQQHSGTDHAPEEVSREHLEAHLHLGRFAQGVVELRLQKDGSSVPLVLWFRGKRYALTEQDG